MGKKTDGEEDPDGWRCKPIGKKGRGKRNKENAYDFASRLPSNTRAGTAYLPPDVTKVDATKVDVERCNVICSIFRLDGTESRQEPEEGEHSAA